MANDDKGPDLAAGIETSRLAEGVPLAGHVDEHEIVLVRRGDAVHALGARCPHRGAALADGIVAHGTIRCPWHHASFRLEDGAARAPSLDALPCWDVVHDGATVRVGERRRFDDTPVAGPHGATGDGASGDGDPKRAAIVIVGAGAAGEAAAETLRALGHTGPLTLLSAEAAPPIDRTNLSKGYLSGDMDESGLALRDPAFHAERDIDLKLGGTVVAIDRDAREVRLEGGEKIAYDRLLLATGANVRRLPVDGADDARVHYLRTLEDARGIVAAAKEASRAVVVGSSFIGLEAAAALRARGIEVTVVAPDEIPLAGVVGEAIGRRVRELHEAEGVVFRLESEVDAIVADGVRLGGGETLAADLIVVGIGVTPDVALAREAGLETDDGVVVDARLATSDPAILAAGDIASYPDPEGRRLRIEHWQVAQRQGQCAARNLMGAGERFADVPFFWSKHYGANIRYAGHAGNIARVELDGDPSGNDVAATIHAEDGEARAMASIGRDKANLAFAATLEERAATTAD